MAALLLLAGVAVLVPTAAQAGNGHGTAHRFVDVLRLDEMNDSGVVATVVLVLKGSALDVTVVARGLEPGQVHMQHIHGLAGDTNATCPPGSAAGAKRLSIAFFHHSNYDAVIECIAPPGKAKYSPVRSGEYRDLKYRQTRLMDTAQKAAVG